jgi:hypothetical protein
MGAATGPKIVTNGLIVAIDANNRKSVIDAVTTSLINTNAWADGQTEGVDYYYPNGSTGENARVLATDPWGNSSVIWETRASGNGNDDGGWNTTFFSIDKTKLYRFSVWVRRTSSTAGGNFYLGTNSDGGVFSTADGTEKGNPYWECSGTGKLTQNQWYLVCGHIYPYNTTYTGNNPDSGYYTVSGGLTQVLGLNYCNIVSDLKWGSGSTSVQHRCYHFYCYDNTTRLQFAYPRIDLCDGAQPSIADLLNSAPRQIKNTVSSSYNAVMNSQNSIADGVFTTTGSGVRAKITDLNLASGTYTIIGASRYSGGTRGRIISSVNNNWLLGHWSNSTENHYAEGWVSSVSAGVSDTVWRIFAASGNTSTDSWQKYVNGVLIDNNSNGSAGPNGIELGGVNDAYEFSDGQVSFLLVYNRVLSSDEVNQTFYALRGRFGI